MVSHTEWQTFDRIEINFGHTTNSYSPLEINIVKFVLQNDEALLSLKDGTIVDLKIISSSHKYQLRTRCLLNRGPRDTSSFMYLSTYDVQAEEVVSVSPVIKLEAFDSPLMGWSRQPWFLGSKFKFTVTELFNNGLSIFYHPAPVQILIPGVKLELKFSNERTGFSKLNCKVLSTVTIDGKSESKLAITGDNSSSELRSFYHQIMATYQNINLKTLKLLGAPPPYFKGNIRGTIASSKKDFDTCLELRRAAYTQKQNSKLSEDMPIEQFGDAFDKEALVFKFNYFHQTVGTARLITRLECSEINTLTKIPDFIVSQGFIEISRLATHMNYRGRDLFLLILQTVLKIGFLLDRRFVLFDCEDHLLPVYKKIGAVEIKNHEIVHPLEGVKLHLVYIDIKAAINGKNMPLPLYILGLIPLQHHLIETGNLKVNWFKRIVVLALNHFSNFLLASGFLKDRKG